ncbi:MAG: hypothetical protein A2W22_05315 [Candidatus Levybacteria bacterium RBG_16_35_11]|nr:MAG: hypothetical protein A2W22_05315 [Candidatus Levybacteria bacterium RBG_16_35_11]
MNDINLGDLSHKLKSPLASIKSIAYILKNFNRNKKTTAYLTAIEDKVNVLNKTIDQLISYLRYQKGEGDFLYQVFDISEIIKQIKRKIKINLINQTIIGDKEKILFALSSSLKIFKKINYGKVLKKSKVLQFDFLGQLEEERKDKEGIDFFLARKIVELHGGKIKIGENKLRVTLPFKTSLPAGRTVRKK